MKYLLFTLAALFVAACSSTESPIARVTSIPAEQSAASPTMTRPAEATATTAPTQVAAAASPTPLANNLPLGSAMQIAAATDTAIQPTPRSAVSFDQFPVPITFDEFYEGFNIRTGLQLSDKLVSLDGKDVMLEGYMAPPLKPELDYFVLTRIRLSFCPFCSTAADWPDDIALIYLPEETTTATEYPVRVIGRIEIGSSIDQETGMVSLVRVYASDLEILN
jgi:hypothetical protein